MPVPAADRRADPRISVRLRAIAFAASRDGSDLELHTVNVSPGGALCVSAEAMPLARPLSVAFDLPEPDGTVRQVVLVGLVVRVEGSGPYQVAMHFVNASSRVLERLRAFIARRMQDGGG